MEFRILKGNIIDARVDAIVLPANTKLKEGSGASEAIFKAAGSFLYNLNIRNSKKEG